MKKRIGRAGRYGSEGIAICFVCEKEEENQFEKIIDSYSLMVTQFNGKQLQLKLKIMIIFSLLFKFRKFARYYNC